MKYLYILGLGLLFAACNESEIAIISDKDEEPCIVINALSSTEHDFHQIYLHKTGITSVSPLKDPVINLTVNGNKPDSIIYGSESVMVYANIHPDDEVNLEISAEKMHANVKQRIPRPVTITKVDTTHIVRKNKFSDNSITHFTRFMISLQLPEGVDGMQYFRFVMNQRIYKYYVRRIVGNRITDIYEVPSENTVYNYDFDAALCENIVKSSLGETDGEYIDDNDDIFGSSKNNYGIFRSNFFKDGKYTLTIDVEEIEHPGGILAGTHEDFEFQVLSIPKVEYFYLGAISELLERGTGFDLSNPPIAPTNIEGGTGIFSIAATATAYFRRETMKAQVGDLYYGDLNNY